MLHRLKQLAPEPLLRAYHFSLAYLAALRYGFPSEKLIVIGVTGTNGKSTCTSLIARVLEENGARVGATSTAIFKVAEKEWLNDTKMTMVGRFQLQKLLRQMVDAGCTYAVVETSSQGVLQYRHTAINYDTVVFTNLTPEHIEAHGGFENYKCAKLELFKHLTARKHKTLGGAEIPKVIVANADDEHAADFLAHAADKRYIFTVRGDAKDEKFTPPMIPCVADQVELRADGSRFVVRGQQFTFAMPGKYNVSNALAAITVGFAHGVSFDVAARGLAKVKSIPGRWDWIEEGQPYKVLVDYSPEPVGLAKVYETLALSNFGKKIHVLGSAGGGRDMSRRPILGEMAGKWADVVIITNEDPYDENPRAIIDQVAQGALKAGKIVGKNLFLIEDRREALAKAVSLAQAGDLVLATGKGSEQAMCVAGGKKLPWDERTELKKAIHDKR
jgi:UDP-N-acetylmuramoyl-L-alanyl-D-glutamate--2,6-diaminopimelate ligase